MRCGVGANTRHHVKTLVATSSPPNLEILAVREVLAHPRAVFYPCTCGLRGDVAAVAIALIGYDDVGLLPRRPRGGDDCCQLLPLRRRTTTLNRCSNSSSTDLRV
jgi:hypothetical protein